MQASVIADAPAPAGLTTAEVDERVRRGEVNRVTASASRSVEDILRANVFTRFNAIVGGLMALILFVGPYQDAVFGLVMVANAVVGIVQELRSKRALDRLRVVTAPTATVIRDGERMEIPAAEVVLDDLVEVERGDQMVVDGVVVESMTLEVDQSILTGESDPVPKSNGDQCLSGSTVLAGRGLVRATVVGEGSHAARLSEEAHRFRLARSELRTGIDLILRIITWLLIPAGLLVAWAQHRADAGAFGDLVRGAVAATVGMIPQGLVLLTSVAMAVGIVRLARRRVLVQELAAIECLARVDVVCFDKTGTLTEGELTLASIDRLEECPDLETVLVSVCSADPAPNSTLGAITRALGEAEIWPAEHCVPFRSDRRWSGADLGSHGRWVLGASQTVAPERNDIADRVRSHAEAAGRVLVLARVQQGYALADGARPPAADPMALVVLADQIRPEVSGTIAYFAEQGVMLKVMSGDDPTTVTAIARTAGITGPSCDASACDDVTTMVEQASVFGRVEPDQKRDMIRELQRRGHVVAMVGDGVNDVPSMKQADIAVAMGTGTQATRTVGQVVLADSNFDRLPEVVAEGRRVIYNIERVAKLYLTKTVYALLLALAVGIAGFTFPLLPRHVTVVGSLTIGIPSFWLAMEPGAERARPRFVERVLRFALPSGLLVFAAGFGAYLLARPEVSPMETQTTTMMVLTGVGLLVLAVAVRPISRLDRALVSAMVAGLAIVLLVPGVRDFYAVDLPRPVIFMAAIGVVAFAGLVVWSVQRLASAWRRNLTRLNPPS
jgi:cation-transporting ATPase E